MTQSIFSAEEFQQRFTRVETALAQAGFDALIAYSVKNQPGPVTYLSGYESRLGLHDVAFFVVAPGGQPRYALLTNAFWDEPRAGVGETIITSDFGARLADLLPTTARRVGIAGYRFFPAPIYATLQAARPQIVWEDATRLLMTVAAIKSPAEIALLRRCTEITDAGGRAFLAAVQEGVNERLIQAEVERAILLAGADGLSYTTQVYSGLQVAVGIGMRQDRTLAAGEQVQVDCGAVYQGYRGDLSRVTIVGRSTAVVQHIMETTAAMYETMAQHLRPGVAVADLAHTAMTVAEAAGMGAYLYRSPNHAAGFVGHGIGCWYHELPEIHPEGEEAVAADMVVVLEPILTVPGVGGAKIEDALQVTPTGAERLSTLPLRSWLA